MEKYRLFVAIDLPGDMRASLARVASDLAGARRVPAGQLHLTLRFIGDADSATLEKIRLALEEVNCSPFTLEVRGVGHFPRSRFPRVLWAGVSPSLPLLQLQEQVELALQAAGIPAEERPFSPHITIARLKEPLHSQLQQFEEKQREYVGGTFTADHFHLYASTLSPGGAIHTRLQSYPP